MFLLFFWLGFFFFFLSSVGFKAIHSSNSSENTGVCMMKQLFLKWTAWLGVGRDKGSQAGMEQEHGVSNPREQGLITGTGES